MFTVTAERTVNAPVDIVWDVISDVERYAHYAPNLSHAEKVSIGDTPARRCYDTQGRGWNEACVLWEEGKQYSYLVDTTDYPYPFLQMKGTWGLDETPSGVRVWMRFQYTPDVPRLVRRLIDFQIRRQFAPIIDALLDNWEDEIREQAGARAAV